MTKLDPTKIGQRRNKQTSTYHQWMYSFKNKKKYQVNRIAVTNTVIIPIVTAPHLIGKHPQQEESLVKSLAHTQSQQQHGALIGGANGSSSSSFLSSSFLSSSFLSSSFFSDFLPDLLEPWDFFSSAAGSSFFSSPSAAPPSNRLSFSLY